MSYVLHMFRSVLCCELTIALAGAVRCCVGSGSLAEE